jgi:hypothetical protein
MSFEGSEAKARQCKNSFWEDFIKEGVDSVGATLEVEPRELAWRPSTN